MPHEGTLANARHSHEGVLPNLPSGCQCHMRALWLARHSEGTLPNLSSGCQCHMRALCPNHFAPIFQVAVDQCHMRALWKVFLGHFAASLCPIFQLGMRALCLNHESGNWCQARLPTMHQLRMTSSWVSSIYMKEAKNNQGCYEKKGACVEKGVIVESVVINLIANVEDKVVPKLGCCLRRAPWCQGCLLAHCLGRSYC